MNIAGVVLAGGRSSRMGTTKALIEIDGVAMANIVIAALRAAGCDPVLVAGGDANELAALDAEVHPDMYPGEGPVGGIVGALGTLDRDGVVDHDGALIVPCDLPDLDQSVLAPLLAEAARSLGTHDVVVARTERIEPLCAVWSARATAIADQFFATGGRAVHRLLDHLDVVAVDVPAARLRNVNTPADLC